MNEKTHILEVLKEAKKSLKNQDYVKIKNLSNEIIHNSSISQDSEVISTAVILYSLSKLIEREAYKQYNNWKDFFNNYLKSLDNLIKSLEKEDIENFRQTVHLLIESIENLTGNLKIYISDVFRKAQINKASRIYEHGISMENTAKMLGITIWELSEYAGQTRIADVNLAVTMPIKQRIKLAEDFFR